jgi:hypothetical protein
MKEILLLTDYNDEFLIALNEMDEYVSMNLNEINKAFELRGYSLRKIRFSELEHEIIDLNGKYVLYQTSEQVGQFYKKYIEDIVYYLELSGAILLPAYKYLKAHHNKGFMELIRSNFSKSDLNTVNSKYFGTATEALTYEPKFPVVIKQISGSGSDGVYCARNNKEYSMYLKQGSSIIISRNYAVFVETIVKNFAKKTLNFINLKKYTLFPIKVERPVVVQEFIENLSGDYKVLYFGGKFYTLYRMNRDNDFRASGGGKLEEIAIEDNYPLLEYAKKIVDEIEFPIIGMDIGFDGTKFHLIEFQMIHIGPYTLERSNHYFIWNNSKWECIMGKSDLVEEFTRSICEYIENKAC